MPQTALETAFLQLLAECVPLVRPTTQPLAKWVHIKKNQQQLKPVRNDAGAIHLGMAIAESRYSDLASYRECKRLYESDVVFKEAPRLAGYWGQFSTVLRTVASRAGTVRRGRVHIDSHRALSQVRTLRDHSSSSSFKYECRARIHGVGLSKPVFFLPDGIELRRLSLPELNRRQLAIQPYEPYARGGPEVSEHRAEARFYTVVPIDRAKGAAFLEAGNQALTRATEGSVVLRTRSLLPLASLWASAILIS